MNKIFPALAAAASLVSLTACDNKDHTIVAGGPTETAKPASTANVVLPPAIAASKTYRCKDNSVVYIDWLSDGSARVKADKSEVGTPVKLGEAGSPLKGSATDASITYNGKTCHG